LIDTFGSLFILSFINAQISSIGLQSVSFIFHLNLFLKYRHLLEMVSRSVSLNVHLQFLNLLFSIVLLIFIPLFDNLNAIRPTDSIKCWAILNGVVTSFLSGIHRVLCNLYVSNYFVPFKLAFYNRLTDSYKYCKILVFDTYGT